MKKGVWKKFWIILAAVVCWMLACPVVSAGSNVTVSYDGVLNYNEANAVLELVNQNRAKEGKQKLVLNRELQQAAMLRAEEQAIFYSHTRPDGTTCYTAFPNGNGMRGENIAAGYADAVAVMTGWMNSQGHRENILKNEFNQIGIGCFEQGGTRYWTQLFSSERNETGGMSGTVRVTAEINVSSSNLQFTVSPSALTLSEGQRQELIVINKNQGWSYSTCRLNGSSFEWKSSAETASVKDGVVTGVRAGTSLITASLGGMKVLMCQAVISHVSGAAATCTEAQKCEVCGEILTPAPGHQPGAAATCTEAQKCEVCGEILTPALGHQPGTAATCTKPQVCTQCGQLLQSALGHTGGTASCKEKAVCERCTEEYGEYADHTWSGWRTTEAATTKSPEKQVKQCAVCGKKETRTVGKKLPEKTVPSEGKGTSDEKEYSEENGTKRPGTSAGDSKAKPKLSMKKVVLNIKQSTTKLKVFSLQKGNSLKSVVPRNKRIVKVSKIKKTGTFKLTGQKAGTTTLTIKLADGESFQAVVQVKKAEIKAIKAIPKKISLKKGKTKALKPKITPSNSGQKITFQSSNKKVATVTAKGKIKAKKKGTAIITVKCGAKKVTCKVTVK